MFDIGWTELLVVGVVALIVIGPKDLPEMFRTLGRFTAKARGMARDFSRAMETAADEAGVKDITKDLKNVTSAKAMGLDAVKGAASKFEAWDPMKAARPVAKQTDKPDAEPAVPAPKGPATQALTEAQSEKRAQLLAAAAAKEATPKKVAKPPASRTAASKPAASKPAASKPAPAKATAAKAAAKAPAKKAAIASPAPKPPRKPSAKKSDA
tara:strand:- start:653 stop:1285 length:633 start_codon:yes stop_codon:yes gene_type:complete